MPLCFSGVFKIWREISSFAPFSAQVADLTKSRAKFLAHNSFSYPLRNEISPFLGEISLFYFSPTARLNLKVCIAQ